MTYLGRTDDDPLHRRVREGLGYVPEDRSVFHSLTVRANLGLGRGPSEVALDLFPELRPLLGRRAGLVLWRGAAAPLYGPRARCATSPPARRRALARSGSTGGAPALEVLRAAADEDSTGVLLVEQQAGTHSRVADRVYVLSRGRWLSRAPPRTSAGVVVSADWDVNGVRRPWSGIVHTWVWRNWCEAEPGAGHRRVQRSRAKRLRPTHPESAGLREPGRTVDRRRSRDGNEVRAAPVASDPAAHPPQGSRHRLFTYALINPKNAWLVSDGYTLVAVYAGSPGEDPSIGRFAIVRQNAIFGVAVLPARPRRRREGRRGHDHPCAARPVARDDRAARTARLRRDRTAREAFSSSRAIAFGSPRDRSRRLGRDAGELFEARQPRVDLREPVVPQRHHPGLAAPRGRSPGATPSRRRAPRDPRSSTGAGRCRCGRGSRSGRSAGSRACDRA